MAKSMIYADPAKMKKFKEEYADEEEIEITVKRLNFKMNNFTTVINMLVECKGKD